MLFNDIDGEDLLRAARLAFIREFGLHPTTLEHGDGKEYEARAATLLSGGRLLEVTIKNDTIRSYINKKEQSHLAVPFLWDVSDMGG